MRRHFQLVYLHQFSQVSDSFYQRLHQIQLYLLSVSYLVAEHYWHSLLYCSYYQHCLSYSTALSKRQLGNQTFSKIRRSNSCNSNKWPPHLSERLSLSERYHFLHLQKIAIRIKKVPIKQKTKPSTVN